MKYSRVTWDTFQCPIVVKDEDVTTLVGFPKALKTRPSRTGKSGAMLVAYKDDEKTAYATRVDVTNIGILPCWMFPRILKGYEIEHPETLFFVSLYPGEGLEETTVTPPFWADVPPATFYVKGNRHEQHLISLAWKKWKKYQHLQRFYRHEVPVKDEILDKPIFPLFDARCTDGGVTTVHIVGGWKSGIIDFLDLHFQIGMTSIRTERKFAPCIRIGECVLYDGSEIPTYISNYLRGEILDLLWRAGWNVENNVLRRRVITEIV